jgi:hypothetical protein
MDEAHCKECESLFIKKREWQIFCTPVCRAKDFVRRRNMDARVGRQLRKAQNNVAPPTQIHRDLFAA